MIVYNKKTYIEYQKISKSIKKTKQTKNQQKTLL